MVVLGVTIGSLPYTLSVGRTTAQQDLGRLKPKHIPVMPDHVTADNGDLYLIYHGKVLKMQTNSIPYNSWQKLPEAPRD